MFWNFYKVVFANTKENLSQEKLKTIQTLLTANAHIMFAIYHSILHLSNYFPLNESDKNIDVIMRVLAGDIQHKTNTTISKKYIELYESLSKSPAISPVEKKIIDLIIPADIILRYLLNKNESKVISKHILTTIYPVESHSELLESFVQDGENAPQIIEEALKFSRLKNFFFLGLHHYIKAKLQDISASRTDISQLFEDEFGDGLDESIDEFLSYLAESDFDSHETGRSQHTTPKNVQIQSITFDKLINFYISYIGGFRISRGDT